MQGCTTSTTPAMIPRYGATKEQLVRELERLGHRCTTSVIVNGRPVLLEAAVRLLDDLPADARLGSRGLYVFIDPDPFLPQYAATNAPQLSVNLVAGLRESLARSERRTIEHDHPRHWWRRVADRFGNGGLVHSKRFA